VARQCATFVARWGRLGARIELCRTPTLKIARVFSHTQRGLYPTRLRLSSGPRKFVVVGALSRVHTHSSAIVTRTSISKFGPTSRFACNNSHSWLTGHLPSSLLRRVLRRVRQPRPSSPERLSAGREQLPVQPASPSPWTLPCPRSVGLGWAEWTCVCVCVCVCVLVLLLPSDVCGKCQAQLSCSRLSVCNTPSPPFRDGQLARPGRRPSTARSDMVPSGNRKTQPVNSFTYKATAQPANALLCYSLHWLVGIASCAVSTYQGRSAGRSPGRPSVRSSTANAVLCCAGTRAGERGDLAVHSCLLLARFFTSL
jgi:hypothetical protein